MSESYFLEPIRRLGNGPFRIEWFGDVTYAGRTGGRSPLILVTLARGHQGQWVSTLDEDEGAPITTAIPAAYLRLIRIGDIWVRGERAGSDPRSIRQTFPDLLIEESNTEIRPAGLPIETDGEGVSYLLPFSEFQSHRGHTGAFCARVQMENGTILVVPCMELIRFYFGASGMLLKTLFSGAFAADNLYTSAKCHPVTGVANLTLAPGLPFPAASTVARIALDWRARKAAKWIAKSGVVAAANGESFYPRTTFPFAGKTDLTADGRWLGKEPHRVFFVERLVQCSYPFPFKRLYARTDTGISGEHKPGSRTAKSSKYSPEGATRDRTLLEGYVTRALVPMAMDADEDIEDPFPDLVTKPIHRMTDVATQTPRSGDTADELSAGATSSSLGGKGAEVMAAQMKRIVWDTEPEDVITFRAAFSELVERGEITASLVPPLSTEKAGTLKSPFLRGDWIVDSTDEMLRDVWCAKVIGSCFATGRRLLVLIRTGGVETLRGHVTLIRIIGPETSEDEFVRSLCANHAADRPFAGQQFAFNPVQVGERAINLESLHAFLRAASI